MLICFAGKFKAFVCSSLQSRLRTFPPMTPVSRSSWRHSTTSPVVSNPKPFPTLHVQWGGPGDRVPTALHPGDVHQCFPGIQLGSSCLTLPGILRASLSFALCSQAATARADLAMTAVTGMVLSLSLSPVLPLRGSQLLPQVRHWPEPPPGSDHCLP